MEQLDLPAPLARWANMYSVPRDVLLTLREIGVHTLDDVRGLTLNDLLEAGLTKPREIEPTLVAIDSVRQGRYGPSRPGWQTPEPVPSERPARSISDLLPPVSSFEHEGPLHRRCADVVGVPNELSKEEALLAVMDEFGTPTTLEFIEASEPGERRLRVLFDDEDAARFAIDHGSLTIDDKAYRVERVEHALQPLRHEALRKKEVGEKREVGKNEEIASSAEFVRLEREQVAVLKGNVAQLTEQLLRQQNELQETRDRVKEAVMWLHITRLDLVDAQQRLSEAERTIEELQATRVPPHEDVPRPPKSPDLSRARKGFTRRELVLEQHLLQSRLF